MNAKIIDKRVKLEQPLIFSGDKNANKIVFEMPCECDGINLHGLPVYVKTSNSLGNYSKAILGSNKSGDNLLIEWYLGLEATGIGGELECQIVFESTDGQVIMNTHPFKIRVENSVTDCGECINVQTNHITQLQNALQEQIDRVDKIIEKGILTDENLEEKLVEMPQFHGNKNHIYQTLEEAINVINYAPKDSFKVGDCIRVKEYGVPHFFVCEIRTAPISQIAPQADALVRVVKQNGHFAAGWYNFNFTSTYVVDQLPLASNCFEGQILTVENGKWVAKDMPLPTAYDGSVEVI